MTWPAMPASPTAMLIARIRAWRRRRGSDPGWHPLDDCQCGHGHDAHAHYRTGTDCALCSCPRWRPV